jgi:hypothetical protein
VNPGSLSASSQVSSDPRGRSAIPIYVGAAITGLGAVTAIGFGVAAQSARNELENLRTQGHSTHPEALSACSVMPSTAPCSEIKKSYDRQREDAVFARVGLAVGVVAGVATLGYWIFWPERAQRDSAEPVARVVPGIVVLPGQTAVSLTGSF